MKDIQFDWQRKQRTGVAEAVLCGGKSVAQISSILDAAREKKVSMLFTRLLPEQFAQLGNDQRQALDYDESSRTGILNIDLPPARLSTARIVTAGTSDLAVAVEAQRTLAFYGLEVPVCADCGVAGLWRLTERLDELRSATAIIAIAGMEGALFPVLAGLVPGLVIAVPTSVGYGVAEGGKAALGSALASCSPGVVVVNIDNGFGAACALLKVLKEH